jgi:GH43 family beta-xylosidase
MEQTYLNPVYPHSFPDPFVMKYHGEYWGYCTGEWPDGRRFGILRSPDLVHWEPLAGALAPLPEPHPHYWAPEVTYANGKFYLYYSVGDEVHMHLRVAVADSPAGPFVDSGRRLTSEQFAIDAHVLIDDDGTWHMFYATDFLERSHIGTGTVRDRMLDPYTLAGRPQPVTLPRYDWHVYDPKRAEKGGVRWHTIEGSFVLKHKGRYYQMFSGGNWQNISYGVSYAVAERPDQPGEWDQVADGEQVLPILRTIPGQVIGPGHNSAVRGPDNMQLYCVYHRWAADSSARVLAIDPLDWAGERLLALGPSTTPQPAPNRPALAERFGPDQPAGLGPAWRCTGGAWAARSGVAEQTDAEGRALAERTIEPAASLVAEISLRAPGAPGGAYGLALGGERAAVLIEPAARALVIRSPGAAEARAPLPADVDPAAFQLLRVELHAGRVAVQINGRPVATAAIAADTPVESAGLLTEGCAAEFAGLDLTVGWETLFMDSGADPTELGWRADAPGWRIADRMLQSPAGRDHATIAGGAPIAEYELVVSARLAQPGGPASRYGFYPAARPGAPGPLLTVERAGDGWALACRSGADEQVWPLPGFDAASAQQLRVRKRCGQLAIQWEARPLGAVPAPAEPTEVWLYAHQAAAAFDLVRVTALLF